ncbi:MAG: hypothetical protein H8F28_12600 [Fibrella sp.]|nr:hypothetical protein [Armatimonadota bacterium]
MTSVAIGLAGCGKKKEVAQTEPPEPPAPTAAETPFVEATPEETPSPEVEATDTPPGEPAAPYGELTDNQQARVDTVMESLGEVNANEAKRWKENLAYDETGAERELQVWEAIADAYKQWSDERPGINDAAKQEAFNAILAGSLLPVTDALRYVKLVTLTRDDAKAAILLYAAPTSPGAEPSPEPSPDASPPPYFAE